MTKINTISALKNYKSNITDIANSFKKTLVISGGTCGKAGGTDAVAAKAEKLIKKLKLSDQIELKVTGCLGFCEQEPIMIIEPEGMMYPKVKPENLEEIFKRSIDKKEFINELLYIDPVSKETKKKRKDIPFYDKQMPLILGNNININPNSINDYIKSGGYEALAKALKEMKPDEVVEAVQESGLRGRGGGGFPTGKKWASCRKAVGDVKYVICNADEGDPGAYMDRSLLEGNPHSVLEGMIIGAYAIGSNHGYIYVRMEYPLAIENFDQALNDARKLGLLGTNILDSGFDFDVKISRGGGAFVCGESSALIASIEGKAGEPRAKHVHMVDKGLWGKPTTLNNVETWANVPLIINKGADWYANIGTEKSKGTKIFSLVGKVNNTGLVEVPMGITLREIIYDIGGGIKDGKKFKAVQTGGPSGGCIPEEHLDLPVDYESLSKVGSMMGSGGMIVMDEDNCMVDLAKYFVKFLNDESCGKCTPCREGTTQMADILENICSGKGKSEDIDKLEELAWITSETSLCQLGATSGNPVLTTLRYFRDEYEAHIRDKKCPAGVCTELLKFEIIPDACTGCTVCAKNCPTDAITGKVKEIHLIDSDKCIKCGICYEVCKFKAITR
jgi:NADH:ubiquinone oxidoreductase subunit F (NADH-binding)/(2Fe-2S) ferredoxin/Pyruvate/2-oxoacid:ferredoxin oxidoreductase delta subunit